MSALASTYRLQLRGGVDLAEARRRVPQLARLGVTHLYLSPVLRARRGSSHGYDVVDPREADPALGGEAGLRALVAALHRHDMGLVLDIVPNHMAADPESPAFADVLAHGPGSRHAPWFDVDWGREDEVAAGRHAPLRLPWLGAPWREAAGRGEIALARHRGRVRLRHAKGWLPVDPAGVAPLLQAAARRLRGEGRTRARLLDLAARARRMPPRSPAQRGERADAVAAWEASLARLLRGSPPAREALDAALAQTSPDLGTPGVARLERVLTAQPFRLGFWRRMARRLNWRRFFDVNDLIGLRCEDPEVFAATHARVLAWVEAGWLDGLRVDHVDGLLEPAVYLQRLRRETSERLPLAMRSRFGIWVEKILARGERLPPSWPVDGTTGYELARDVDAVLLHAEGAERLEADWRRRSGVRHDFAEEAVRCKRRVADELLAADLDRTTDLLAAELEREGTGRPAPLRSALRAAVRETVVHLRRYRTYMDEKGRLRAGAREAAREAVDAARREGRAPQQALERLEQRLLGGGTREPRRVRRRPPDFVERLQQLSGPVAAKGIEDTALYRFTPLLSRCEVGAEPDVPLEVAVGAFHAGCAERVRSAPRTLLAGSTHDTKRSADVRARLDALSECPRAWTRTLDALEACTDALRAGRGGERAPDRRDLHALFQLLVGVWPADPERRGLPPVRTLRALAERLETVARKSAREAKRRTSWLEPDAAYEDALGGFVRALLDPERGGEALRLVDRFVRDELLGPGLWNVLARVLLQGTAPGIPDLYQGDERLCLALVDPDNRRPVDWDASRRAIAEMTRLREAPPARRRRALERALRAPDPDRAKLLVLGAVLQVRRAHPALFREGDHLPLAAEGPGADHLVAFARRRRGGVVLAAAARHGRTASGDAATPPTGAGVWEKTHLRLPRELARRRLRCALTGEVHAAAAELPVARLLDPAPVALWIAGDS